jgi:uncharacterized protein YfeS
MNRSSLTTFLINILLLGCSSGQTKNKLSEVTQQNQTVDTFQYTLQAAHPSAQAVMKDDFYFSPIEETGPFGSDDGWEAAYGFREWRLSNKTASPVTYLNALIGRWQYPFFNYSEMDTIKIKEYINQKKELSEAEIQQQIKSLKEVSKNSPETPNMKLDDNQLREVVLSSSKEMNGIYLVGQDNAIIGIGFSQFVLEGRIDKDIKALTITAIKRQLLPLLINRYDDNYRDKRKDQLTKMLEVVKKAAS